MKELISRFNTDKTHIEVDAINQKDNGMTNNPSLYSYTILLVLNDERYSVLAQTSLDLFDEKEIKHAIHYFETALKI